MARKYPKRYHEYRGRRRGGNPVLKIIIALLVLILLAFLVFMVLLGGRVEYTDEGVRLVLPWTEEQPNQPDEPVDPPSPSSPIIVIEDPDEPTQEPASEPEPEVESIGAVEVTDIDLIEGRAASLVTEAGGNALVVEMKDSGGRVYWDSKTALPGAFADPRGVATDKSAVRAAIQALAEEGSLYLVARVNCFRDQVLVANKVGGPLMTKGGNMWYDSHGLRWVSPASEEVRTYLIQLCLELAALGFDEILLDCAGYPYFGEVHVLATDALRPEDLSGPVEQFWRELKAALAAENVRMSVLVNEDMALGSDEHSGITPDLLGRYADRVWAPALTEGSYDGSIVVVGGTAADGNWADIRS